MTVLDDPQARDLTLINLLASMAWRIPGFPAPLADAGFALWGLEREIITTDGSVKPDVGFTHRAENHTLLFECKSGAANGRQSAKYRAIDATSYASSAFEMSDPTSHSHQVAYAVELQQLQRGGRFVPPKPFPIVAIDSANRWDISKYKGEFSCSAAAKVFAKPFRLPDNVPQIVRYHPQTADVTIMMGALTAIAVGLIRDGNIEWTVAELIQETLEHEPGIAQVYSGSVRTRMRNALRTCLPDAAEHELNPFVGFDYRRDVCEVKLGSRGAARWLRLFREPVQEYLHRLAAGKSATPQMTLPLTVYGFSEGDDLESVDLSDLYPSDGGTGLDSETED